MTSMRTTLTGRTAAAAIRTALCLVLTAFAAAAHAQLDVRVTEGVERPVPIAIVRFAGY